MRDDLSNLRVNPKGSLRISASQRLGRSHIAPIVSLMKKRYPELEIGLELVDRRSAQSAKVRVCVDFLKQEHAQGEFALWKT
ncbi:hypothetical protein [Paraburkholderia lacunae]|uniref:LysR substrate-binding domain-containing protein n=1 Tax=Paraburkholderia lacunae TaxID=2211104 RepID=A0A370N808_9BURK|nr:hypothetical protein [Paraburkholderia lacunae]RDK01722.1 hypothetical protein DLM46_15245 [Paraburkholderia lacunae]